MSIKTDFQRLAGLPITESLIVEVANPAFKDKHTLSLVKRALVTLITVLDEKGSKATVHNLKNMYHLEMVAYDKLLGLFSVGKHAAVVKEYSKLDHTAQNYMEHVFDDAHDKETIMSYFNPQPESVDVFPDDVEVSNFPAGTEPDLTKEDVSVNALDVLVEADKVVKQKDIEVIASPEDGIVAKEKEIEKDDNENEDDKVPVPADIYTDIDAAIKELEDKINDKYIAHLPNIGKELNRYAEVIEILKFMKDIFKSGDALNIKKVSILLTSLDGAMKPLIPGCVWKFLSIQGYNKSMVASLKDLFKEIKIKP